jgi:hypothetical protein
MLAHDFVNPELIIHSFCFLARTFAIRSRRFPQERVISVDRIAEAEAEEATTEE